MMGAFLKFILITFLIILLFKLFAKTFLPSILNKIIKKVLFGNSSINTNFNNEQGHNGETIIKGNNRDIKNKIDKNIGEYTDYEEIK